MVGACRASWELGSSAAPPPRVRPPTPTARVQCHETGYSGEAREPGHCEL